MQDKHSILIPEGTYHVYNRANGDQKLFFQEDNFSYFLDKYKNYVLPIADTLCYCLMPNHFHFLIRIKSINQLCQGSKPLTELNEIDLSSFLSKQFSHLFNGYTQAINMQENRKGSLFMRPFKRKRVADEKYMRKLVHYIHHNPVEAGLVTRPEEWRYSSYRSVTQNQADFILKDEVISLFNDLENFIHCHRFSPKETGIEDL